MKASACVILFFLGAACGIAPPKNWGVNALFAFSGFDGPTDSTSGFTLTLGSTPLTFNIHLDTVRLLTVTVGAEFELVARTGDVVQAKLNEENTLVQVTYDRWHTLVISGPEDVVLHDASSRGECRVIDDSKQRQYLALAENGTRFALSFDRSSEGACQRAVAGLGVDVNAVVEKRLLPYAVLPASKWGGKYDRLLAACYSVMRVNSLGPEQKIARRWSTPDRVPHKWMWLWDRYRH